MGELPPGADLEELLAAVPAEVAIALGLQGQDKGSGIDLRSASPEELVKELAKRVADRVQQRLMGGDPWAEDPIGLNLPGYRDRYYQVRLVKIFQMRNMKRLHAQ
jgi:hypothetical protein